MANRTLRGYRTQRCGPRVGQTISEAHCYNRSAAMNAKLRVCAVSYLNTAPLVWGLTHGRQQGLFDLEFALPSACADKLRLGETDVGLVPIIELARQPDLVVVPGTGVSCRGPVRSIVLVCKKPFGEIESFAADTGSRTSVGLVQILAARVHGIRPRVRPYPPRLTEMLEVADAALVIGNPALRIDPAMASWHGQPVHVYDLGAEWEDLTGLPMVFAVWAVKNRFNSHAVVEALTESAAYGQSRIDAIVAAESSRLDFDPDLVRTYLTEHVRYALGAAEREAISLYLRLAAELGLANQARDVQYLAAPEPVQGGKQ